MNIVNVGYHSTNYYALDVEGGKLLVDCGWPGTLPQFAAELRRKGISLGEIKYLLATHFHPDHAGLVEELKACGATLILMENQTSAVRSGLGAAASDGLVQISADHNLLVKFSESRLFLASIGLQGEIISTPGHSDDSISLMLDNGFVFTGDLPPRFMVADEDRITISSWERIYSHKVSRIFPAHGAQN